MTEETLNEMDSSNHEVAAEEAEMADATAADTQANDRPPPRLMISKMVRSTSFFVVETEYIL